MRLVFTRFPLNQKRVQGDYYTKYYEYYSAARSFYSCNVYLFFAIIFVSFPTFFAVDKDNNVHVFGRRMVTTPFGVVRGETILPTSDDDLPAVTQFLGIPYGVAPVGQVCSFPNTHHSIRQVNSSVFHFCGKRIFQATFTRFNQTTLSANY